MINRILRLIRSVNKEPWVASLYLLLTIAIELTGIVLIYILLKTIIGL